MPAPLGPLIILNPAANRGQTAQLLGALAAAADGAAVIATRAPGEATRLATDAARRGHTPIVAVGGDGTIHEVAVGVLQSGCDVPLGIVAAGSGNDYAYEALRLPRDPATALAVALGGQPRRLDVARLNDGWLLNAFGAGVDARVAWDVRDLVARGRVPVRGQALYTVSALRQILFYYHRLPKLDITCDGTPVHHGSTLLAAVMIGPTAGGGYRFTPAAQTDDGLLDLCIARRMLQPKVLGALLLAKQGRHTGLREVQMLRGRQVQIRSQGPVQAHVDGELLSGTRFDITLVPGALQVMTEARG